MRDRSSGCPGFKEKPSNVRILSVDILTFNGFFGAIFDILTPKWLPTGALPVCRRRHFFTLHGAVSAVARLAYDNETLLVEEHVS